MSRLILTLNNKVLSSHSIAPGSQLTIGRKADNEIVIDHPSVSAYHAELHLHGQQLAIKDLKSQNGTFVNDEKITECQLGHQDWIAIGRHLFIVDIYGSLSIEVAENELKARSQALFESGQTMALNREEIFPGYLSFNYLSFINPTREDFDLNEQMVSIGKNKDADIRIQGLQSIFAGAPSATIKNNSGLFILAPVAGMLKPKVNGKAIKGPTKLNHQDIIKIGSLEMQFRAVRRPLHYLANSGQRLS